MEATHRVALVTAVAVGVLVYTSGATLYGAAFSGLFWGALAWVVMWLRQRWRARA